MTMAEILKFEGFSELHLEESWALIPGGRYFVIRDGSVIAFVLGKAPLAEAGYRIAGAHTDSPGLRLKPNPVLSGEGLIRLGVEVYGGAMIATFADRDLALAGRIHVRQGAEIASKLIHINQSHCRLPTLAIHMNRDVNETGLRFHRQNELNILFGSEAGEWSFSSLLAREAGIKESDLLASDLLFRDADPGRLWGANEEFIAAPQIDNLASCHAILNALIAVDETPHTAVAAFFDHEEVGSASDVGAAGPLLDDVLSRIGASVFAEGVDERRARAKSLFISADMAHAWNPNFPHAYEPQHKVRVNEGVAVKFNVNQRYATDSAGYARVQLWAEQADVPLQTYVHRSELSCGSTIGPISATRLGIRTVDLGAPMWSMHSARESAGVMDQWWLYRLLTEALQTG
jgi:aspartyl aminopeptidase